MHRVYFAKQTGVLQNLAAFCISEIVQSRGLTPRSSTRFIWAWFF